MTRKITPLIKGLITGGIMVIMMFWFAYIKLPQNSPLQYLAFAIYAGGIAWTLIDYSRSPEYVHKFSQIFGQGFRCFVIITIIIVVATAVYIRTHPEIVEETAKAYREALVKDGNKMKDEIDVLVAKLKKEYLTSSVSTTIFGTLFTGAIFTTAGAGLLLIRRK